MALTEQSKNSIAFKKLVNKDHRNTSNQWYEELDGGGVNVHSVKVWADAVPAIPPLATSAVVKVYVDGADGALQLIEDISVPNRRGWAAGSVTEPGRLRGWIPPKYGQAYTVKLYEDDGTGLAKGAQIFTTDNMNWFFDYETGYLSIQDTHSYTTPFWIEAYQYIGQSVDDKLSGALTGYWDRSTLGGNFLYPHSTSDLIAIGDNSWLVPNAQLQVASTAVGTTSFLVQAFTGQTADLQQWQDELGNVVVKVTATGQLGFLEEDVVLRQYYSYFKAGNQTGDISYTLPTSPSAGSSYVLTSNVLGVLSWTNPNSLGYVPYVGATANVNLNTRQVSFYQGAGPLSEAGIAAHTVGTRTLRITGGDTAWNGRLMVGTGNGTANSLHIMADSASVGNLAQFGAGNILIGTNSWLGTSATASYNIVLGNGVAPTSPGSGCTRNVFIGNYIATLGGFGTTNDDNVYIGSYLQDNLNWGKSTQCVMIGSNIARESRNFTNNILIGRDLWTAYDSLSIDNVVIGRRIGTTPGGPWNVFRSVFIGGGTATYLAASTPGCIFIGTPAGSQISQGTSTVIGYYAACNPLQGVQTGDYGPYYYAGESVILGSYAGSMLTSTSAGYSNTFVGASAGAGANANGAVFVGRNSGLVAPPSTMTVTVLGAGNVNAGRHYWIVQFQFADGTWSTPQYTPTTINLVASEQVQLSNIPIYSGPQGCIARRIFRDRVTQNLTFRLLTTIPDNVTTTYIDDTADAGLGAILNQAINYPIAIGDGAKVLKSGQCAIGSANSAITEMYLGRGTDATTAADLTLQPTGRSGTDVSPGWFRVSAGRSTGTAPGGDLRLAVTLPGPAGNIWNTFYDALTIRGTSGFVQVTSRLGFLESGASPTYYTYFQAGDQTAAADIIYTLPTTQAAGSNYTLSNTAGTLSWVPPPFVGLPWTATSADINPMEVNHGYITTNNVAQVNLTLPATSQVGDVIKINSSKEGGWRIIQVNADHIICLGDTCSTPGPTGYVEASLGKDSIEMVCVEENKVWDIISVVGDIDFN